MNTPRRLASLFALLALAGVADAARDPTDPFEGWKGENETGQFEFDESLAKPWQESATKLPPLPADDELLAVEVDSLTAPLQAHIGVTSLSYDPSDRVLRYWLVITSPAGAYNATYEGMRCDTGEYKVYGYGNPRREPAITAAPNPGWKPIGNIRPGSYRPEMMLTLLCAESHRPRPLAEILDTLRGHRPYRNPSAENTDF